MKVNYKTLRLLIQIYGQFRFFRKEPRNNISTTFCLIFQKKMSVINRPNFIAVISWDMGQYVYCSVFEVNLIFQIYIMQKLRQGD